MRARGEYRLFPAGIGWGGIWMSEFTAYPELDFFALAACLIGLGALGMRWLPRRLREVVEFLLLLLAMVMPAGWLRTVAVPVAFGSAVAGSLCEAETMWRVSRRLCSGLLLGAVLSAWSKIEPNWFFLPLLATAVWNFSLAPLRLIAAGVSVAVWIMYVTPLRAPDVPVLTQGSMLTALSTVERENRPLVLVAGGDRDAVTASLKEALPAIRLHCLDAVSPRPVSPADLIVAVKLPPLADGGVHTLARDLRDGGVLVLPAEAAGNLPDWQWRRLPAPDDRYLIAAKNRPLTLDPDQLDAKLHRILGDRPPMPPLPGALAGMLADYRGQTVRVTPGDASRLAWFLGLTACALALGAYATRPRMDESADGDRFLLMLNGFGFAMLAALSLPLLLAWLGHLPGITRLSLALGTIWVLRRPAKKREKPGRRAGLCSVLFLLLGTVFHRIWLIPALFCGGYAFSSLDMELRKDLPRPVEPLRFLSFGLGVAAVWCGNILHVPMVWLLLVALFCRTYSWLRN